MNPLVVDASVVVKRFLPEQHSHEALLIREGFVDGTYQLIAPGLVLSELANVLWKRRELIDEAAGLAIIRDLLALGITLVPSEQLIARAYRLARQHDRTVYDSLYLALAESRNCPLVTADMRLYDAVAEAFPHVQLLAGWELPEAG